MLFRIPLFQAIQHIGSSFFQVFLNTVVNAVAFYNQFLEIVVKNIANNPNNNIGLALEQMRPFGTLILLELLFHIFPLLDQVFQIVLDGLFTGSIGGSTDNHPHIIGSNLGNNIL